MCKESKVTLLIALVALVIGVVGLLRPTQPIVQKVGGVDHIPQENFIAGLKVAGTEVISSARAITATALTVINGSNTTTVAIGGSGSSVPARKCMWNGSNYTVTYYPANSTSLTVATSTVCQ